MVRIGERNSVNVITLLILFKRLAQYFITLLMILVCFIVLQLAETRLTFQLAILKGGFGRHQWDLSALQAIEPWFAWASQILPMQVIAR